MKKFISVFLGVFLMFSVAGSASAARYKATYDGSQKLDVTPNFSWEIPSVDWTFDITKAGFDPETEFVTAAFVTLSLKDDGDLSKEWAQFKVGTKTEKWELAKWEVDRGLKTISGDLSSIFPFLNEDGTLDVTLKATDGDFWFNSAKLRVEAMDLVATPIPAAAWLLGSGLVGLAGVRRRLRK